MSVINTLPSPVFNDYFYLGLANAWTPYWHQIHQTIFFLCIINYFLPRRFWYPIQDVGVFTKPVFDDTYCEVLNGKEAIDAVLHDCKNRDLDIDWYNIVDISSVQIQNEFHCKQISNAYVFHENNYDYTVETAFLHDNTI